MTLFATVKSCKFPVIFPVSREFGGRRVSARLRAPPRSLNCREIPPPVPRNTRKMPHFHDNSSTNRTAENALHARLQQAEVNVVTAVQRQVCDLFTIYQSAEFAARRLYQRRSAFYRHTFRERAYL